MKLALTLLFTLTQAGLIRSEIKLPEAAQVALEAGLLLLPDPGLTKKVYSEISFIRSEYEDLVGEVFHQPKWVPGQLLSSENPNTPGNGEKFARLNSSRFGPIVISRIGSVNQIDFTRPYEPEILSGIIQREFKLRLEPNLKIGRNQIIEYDRFRKWYIFRRGLGDCSAGCSQWSRYWFEEYTDGSIHIVFEPDGPIRVL